MPPSDKHDMPAAEPFDSLIASSGRLRILAALATEPRLEFVGLRKRTHLTDGNLCTHTRRLESAGFVAVEKSFRDRKPVTHVRLTPVGRDALERHARELLAVLGMESINSVVTPAVRPAPAELRIAEPEDDWID
jgi:DNA-binding MarR family transcriptional regulator